MSKKTPAASTVSPYIVLRRAEELAPSPRNPRQHSDAHVAEIAASILEWGWTNPILADEFIRAGHGRQKAALHIYADGGSIRLPNGKQLPRGFVPVIDCTGWSDAQKRAYVIADNKLADNSYWDEHSLQLEVANLKGFDLSLIGFATEELNDLLGTSAVKMAEPPESVKSNVEEIAEIKRRRHTGDADKAQKGDTEHYVVVVFANRGEREATLKRLGLPPDERYIHCRSVELRPRFGARSSIAADRSIKAAPQTRSGATG